MFRSYLCSSRLFALLHLFISDGPRPHVSATKHRLYFPPVKQRSHVTMESCLSRLKETMVKPVLRRGLSRAGRVTTYFSPRRARLNLRKDESPATHPQKDSVAFEKLLLRLKMIGASTRANINGDEELIGKVNYFVGNDPSRWLANIPTYAKVRYTGIFPGIDLVYYGNRTQLEYAATKLYLRSGRFQVVPITLSLNVMEIGGCSRICRP